MSNGRRTFVIILTVFYSMIWFALLFIVVGFFMIKPVAFYNKISGKVYSSSNNKQTSKYGLSDDPVMDEIMFDEEMDEN